MILFFSSRGRHTRFALVTGVQVCSSDLNEALGLSLGASCIGTLIGYVILMLLIKPLTGIVLSLGPTEMFVIILWGLTLIATLSGAYMTRSLLIGVAGLLEIGRAHV